MISSGTVFNEQCRLSTDSTWRLQPLNIGMHLNILCPVLLLLMLAGWLVGVKVGVDAGRARVVITTHSHGIDTISLSHTHKHTLAQSIRQHIQFLLVQVYDSQFFFSLFLLSLCRCIYSLTVPAGFVLHCFKALFVVVSVCLIISLYFYVWYRCQTTATGHKAHEKRKKRE